MISVSTPSDLKYIVSLANRHAEELGFLTKSAMENYLLTNRVRMARENGDPCGFFLFNGLKSEVKIFQACVQMDARGLDHGRALLGDLIARAAAAGSRRISLHCRDGLVSNGFWSACGFSLSSCAPGGGARRKIVNTWSLTISQALSNPSLPYAAEFLARLRAPQQERAVPAAGSCQP